MSDDTQTLQDRTKRLRDELEAERRRYLSYARANYWAVQIMSWSASAAGVAAALLGLIPLESVTKWEVGLLAALSAALITTSHQLGFQQKANWHYRKEERLTALRRRLEYEVSPSANGIAAISRAWSRLDSELSEEWEDMQDEPPASPRGSSPPPQ